MSHIQLTQIFLVFWSIIAEIEKDISFWTKEYFSHQKVKNKAFMVFWRIFAEMNKKYLLTVKKVFFSTKLASYR